MKALGHGAYVVFDSVEVGAAVGVGVGVGVEVGALGKPAAEDAVGVLVGGSLPRGVWVAEVDREPSMRASVSAQSAISRPWSHVKVNRRCAGIRSNNSISAARVGCGLRVDRRAT